MKILVINGPNLNLLGIRDKFQYGSTSLSMLQGLIESEFPSISFTFYHTNSEAEFTSLVQNYIGYDGILLNPGALTHSSVSIRDAIEAVQIPIIEVHLSNISSREGFRKRQITSSKTLGYISGFKENSYLAGVFVLIKMVQSDLGKV